MINDPQQVSMAHYAVSKNKSLMTTGVGSCIVIVLYDSEAKIGGLAHPMLPDDKFEKDNGEVPQRIDPTLLIGSARTVNHAIDSVLAGIEAMGGKRERCVAKVAGGAHMFTLFDAPSGGVGKQNIEAVREKCSKEKINVIAEDTGGSIGRIVEFDVQSGLMNVTTRI